ncbi:MAG: hypothetical protein P8Z42_04300 [Anaerolineales bacterium]|jgi:hypothetical protein
MESDENSVKLLISYDPLPERWEAYLSYVRGEFVPALEHLGLVMCDAWYTAYGSHPLRLAGFLASDLARLKQVLESEDFQDLERRLKEYVVNYSRKIVPHRATFQY